MRSIFVGACVILCLGGLAGAANVQYKFSSAGHYPGAVETVPEGDNILGEIVGWYFTSSVHFGYIEDLRKPMKDRFRSIQPAGGGASWLSGINSHGVAAGGYCPPVYGCNFPQAVHGFTFDHGEFTSIDYPAAGMSGYETTIALGINDNGQVVGGHCPHIVCPDGLNATDHAFLDTNGVFTELDYPGAMATQANAINNAGIVAGVYDLNNTGPHSFMYRNGLFTNIDVPGATATYASAINNRGVIVGYYQVNFQFIHGFLRYKDGKFVTVDHPDTDFSPLLGINDAGVIVGTWAPLGGHGFPLPYMGVPVHSSQ